MFHSSSRLLILLKSELSIYKMGNSTYFINLLGLRVTLQQSSQTGGLKVGTDCRCICLSYIFFNRNCFSIKIHIFFLNITRFHNIGFSVLSLCYIVIQIASLYIVYPSILIYNYCSLQLSFK